MRKHKKNNLFCEPIHSDREKEWVGMPEFVNEEQHGCQKITLRFKTREDVEEFAKLINQKVSPTTKSLWYPKIDKKDLASTVYVNQSNERMNPRYPLYIVSKGRWKSRLTSRTLESMNVPYYIVIESQEYKKYAKVIDKKKLLILDTKYQDEYDVFDDLGDTKSKGPGPARNFAWDHAISLGYKWHWVMDDNISKFCRFNNNLLTRVTDGTIFRCMEDFVRRYKNIAMAGPQYYMFIVTKGQYPPFVHNTRIYSCNLIRNDVPFRWRGRYNEDTDLSIRMMQAKWCTVQFNAFIQDKMTTQTIKGGNSKEFYDHEGTLNKSLMLKEMHPNITRVVKKYNRWHHSVYYNHFKKIRPIKKEKYKNIKEAIDNYGMALVKRTDIEQI
jgi:hypothetical protein